MINQIERVVISIVVQNKELTDGSLVVIAVKVTLRLGSNLWLVSVWWFSCETSSQQPLFRSLCLTLECFLVLVNLLFRPYIFRPGPVLGWSGLPALTLWRVKEGGSAQPQAVRWARLAWNVGDTPTWTHELHLSTHTRTLKLPCRQSDNNSLASIHFFFWWEQSLLPVWIIYCQSMYRQTQRHLLSLISDVTYPFNPCFCISIFLPPPLLLVNPWHDRAPLSFGPPWLSVSLADNGDICLYKEAALPCPSFLPHVLSLSLSLSSSSSLLHLSSSLSVNCDNSLICHSPVCLFLGALLEAYQCKGASELCDWVNTGTGAR